MKKREPVNNFGIYFMLRTTEFATKDKLCFITQTTDATDTTPDITSTSSIIAATISPKSVSLVATTQVMWKHLANLLTANTFVNMVGDYVAGLIPFAFYFSYWATTKINLPSFAVGFTWV